MARSGEPGRTGLAAVGEVLADLALARELMRSLERRIVQLLRGQGATWEEIGDALGISLQAARERYGPPRS